ncbi:unnamed protein product, partial [Polarella glacialis]
RRYHAEALEAKRRAPAAPSNAELATSYAAIATDCMMTFELEAALVHVRQAQALQGLPPAAMAVLFRQEADIHRCADDFSSALHRFEHAEKLSPQLDEKQALKHLELLRLTLASSGNSMPQQVRNAMSARVRHISAQLLAHGPWQRADQLPQRFLPGLLAKPWHLLPGQGPDEATSSGSRADEAAAAWRQSQEWLKQGLSLLRSSHLSLVDEYADLDREGLLRRDTECIHRLHEAGAWRRFEVNAVWEARGADGCAEASPSACALVRKLRAAGMPLIRAGYSAVGPRAWLKPHHGVTNGQLKWHLGLRVPGDCATMRVGNESRSWTEGEVLFFDDSFEHEVWNRCSSERVVFQLVFAHPQLSLIYGGAVETAALRATDDH